MLNFNDWSKKDKKTREKGYTLTKDEPFLLDLKTQNHLSNRGLENVSILGVERNLYLIEEDISNDYIRWKVKNKFWVDPEDFFVWKSIQYISPKLPEFIFEVTKKPSNYL